MVPRRCERNPRNSRNTDRAVWSQSSYQSRYEFTRRRWPAARKGFGNWQKYPGTDGGKSEGKSVVGEIRCLAWLHTISEILVLQG